MFFKMESNNLVVEQERPISVQDDRSEKALLLGESGDQAGKCGDSR